MTTTDSSRPRAVRRKRINCKHITEYMRLVETGKVKACAEQHKLVAYVRRVFAEESLVIDYARLERYEGFQQYFPFELFPWEWFVLALFLCVFKADGRPRWRELFILVGRGAGKNALLSFLAFCAISKTNGVECYNVDICANSEKQAATTFKDLKRVLDRNKAKLKRRFDWNKTEITSLSTGSEVHFYTGNPETKDGLRPGMVMFDEVHQYEDYDNIDVYTTALGKVPCPRIVYTTTDGYVRDGVLDDLKKRARQVLDGNAPDNGLLPFVCKIDSEDEVYDPANWEKSNPSLPYRPDLFDEMMSEFETFKINPVKARGFLVKRMNWPKENVDLVAIKREDILRTNRSLPDLAGLPCVCGIDFAQSTDFMSAVLLFRVDGCYYAIHHSWFCMNSRDYERFSNKVKSLLPVWEEQGYLTIVHDADIKASMVVDWLYEQLGVYDIRALAMDYFRYSLLMRELAPLGFSREEKNVLIVRPGDIMKIQPKINSVFVQGNVAWDDDGLMRWFTGNVKLEVAPNNNYKYGKIEEKSRKTDGFMAFVHAMCDEMEIPEDYEIEFLEPITI